MPTRTTSATGYLVLLTVAVCFIVITLDRVGMGPALRSLTTALYAWAVLLSAFALLLGVFNVLLMHLRRIYLGETDWGGSTVLVVALLAVLVAGLLDPQGATGPVVEWIFDAVLAPGQAMLFALLAFFTAAAAYRYLRVNQPGGVWMVAGALLMFVAQMPVSAAWLPVPLFEAMAWLLTHPLLATVRGVLLGSGLALLIAGLRFLIGRTDR